MDSVVIRRHLTNQRHGRVFPHNDTCKITAGLTYSRFRGLFTFPRVRAQEIKDVHAKDGDKQDSVEGAEGTAERTGFVGHDHKQVSVPPKDSKTIMKLGSSGIVSKEEVMELIRRETGRDRLRDFFGKDAAGKRSPELYLVIGGTLQAAVFGLAIAGIIGSRVARDRYKAKHVAAAYETKVFALRGLYDAMLVGGLGFGAKWALRLGTFTGSFLLLSQSIAVYRNKTGAMEYAVAGATTGSLFRMNMGLRGMIAAGIIGGAFGSVAGLLIWGASQYTGDSIEKRRFERIHEQLLEERSHGGSGVPTRDFDSLQSLQPTS